MKHRILIITLLLVFMMSLSMGVQAQTLYEEIDEPAIGIAPLAVVFVEASIRIPPQNAVLEGHAAALADQLSGRTQERVDGDVKEA